MGDKMRKKENHHHGQFLDIDLISQNSTLKEANGKLKCMVAISVLLMVIAGNNMLFSAITIGIMAFITVGIGGVPMDAYIKLMKLPFIFIFLSAVAIAFSISRTKVGIVHCYLLGYYLCITKNGLTEAFRVSLNALGAISSLYMLSLTTPMYEIIEVLKTIRLPQVMIELMFLIYRFIFIMLKMQAQMHISAESRLGYSGVRSSFFSFTHIGANLLAISFKKAGDYYDAMVSRGYDGNLIFLTEERGITVLESVYATIFLVCMIIAMVTIKLKGWGI